jgi:fructose 5-dehydrogenase cytochrome subunit
MKQSRFLKPVFSGIVFMTTAFIAHSAVAAESENELIKRGEYLSRAGDCIACHTSEHGGKPYAGGYEFPMPMGKIISSNITPSKTFGIGNYTEADFSRAVREGVAPDGTRLYPAMPYTEYSKVTDEDMHALYVYFMKGIKPVEERPAEETVLKFPFNLPGVMRVWNALFLDTKTFQPDPAASAEVNRGHYLVDGLAHCTSCHTPRNDMMAVDNSKYLQGATVGGWYAPNLTSDPVSGIGSWSNEELVQYLRTGHVEGKAQAGGGMAEAVQNSFQHLNDADLKAIASYLKTVKPVRDANQRSPSFAVDKAKDESRDTYEFPIEDNASPPRHDNLSNVSGPSLYNSACAACHGMNGKGTPDQVIPSLTNNTAVGAELANNVVMAISQGIHRESQGKVASMPAFSAQAERITSALSPAQIASVTNYVMAQYGKGDPQLTAQDVLEIQQGGGSSFLIRNAALLAWCGIGGGLVALLIVLIFVVESRRKKRA